MELSNAEIKILNVLKKLKLADEAKLTVETGLNPDGVRRSMYFLSEKGLAELITDEKPVLEITEKGRAVRDNLPQERLISYNGKLMSELPNDLKVYVNVLGDFQIGKIENGRLHMTGNIKEYGDDIAIDKLKDKTLLTKGYYRQVVKKRYSAKITDAGRTYEIKEAGIGKLTREMLETGSWKGMEFKPFLIKPEDVEPWPAGMEHPISIAIAKIKNAFLSMGFIEMTGNYVETSFWNFDALYQPQDHPSRELADTFYLSEKSNEELPQELIKKVKKSHEKGWQYKWKLEEAQRSVLRTHTTALSVRTLSQHKSGKFFAIGRVFRNEAIDYKHLAEFHQVEGIIADKRTTFRDLLGILQEFYRKIGFPEVRFNPSYYPYTEPSLQIEVWFEPKQEWVELGGAGIFRSEVVEPLGCEYPVLAWGLSLERPLMMLMGLEDIRAFYRNDNAFQNRGMLGALSESGPQKG